MIPRYLLLTLFIVSAVLAPSGNADEAPAKPGVWPVERLKTQTPEYRIEDRTAKVQSLIYSGEPVGGNETEVFAFYASPKTLGKATGKKKFPGIVLIHGGGGTAFADWVWLWANRGYAAIAMDLHGARPSAPEYDEKGNLKPHLRASRTGRVRLAKSGEMNQKFECIGGAIDDDWPYHAVASVMRAHTLLRSFPEVDANRTAVTGISWGGYTTCLVASLDDRFKAAVPVYGCGFLHEGESVQKPSIDKLGQRAGLWVKAYDPGSHLHQCTVPTLWVNGTHDKHYVLDSYAKSYAKVKGPRTIRIQPHMRHSHSAGWEPAEIQIFIDSILKDGSPLAKAGKVTVAADGSVSAAFQSDHKIIKAELHFTTQTGLRSSRKWDSIPCTIADGKVVAKGLPAEANTWVITLTDSRNAMVSTEVGFR